MYSDVKVTAISITSLKNEVNTLYTNDKIQMLI